MKFEKNPPAQKTKGEFPVLNDIVTVANCWYYLSLLERFVDITQSIEEEYVLKMYLVRAEYRYFKWISTNKVTYRQDRNAVPPLDVAFFWQTHLLSPVRYEEDTYRTAMYNPIKIPLQKIHEFRGREPSHAVNNIWKNVMGDEPYNLTVTEVLKPEGYAWLTCIICFNKIQSPWKEYTEWRTDHSVALQCHCCDAMFTVKHVGKANLFADNNEKVHKTAGLLTSFPGNKIRPDSAQLLLLPLKETKALPFNQGIRASLDYYLSKKRGENPHANEAAHRKKFTDAIQSTYLCTPYRGSSIDLIQAVARQYKFAYKATKVINWDIPQGIVNGIRNYSKFLAVIKENPTLTAVPTFEIDLAWHTHMLFHTHYRKFTINQVGKMINHDDNIPEVQLGKYVNDTNLAWQKRTQKHKEAMAPPPLPRYESVMQQSEPEVISNPVEEKGKSGGKTAFLKSLFSSSSSSSQKNLSSTRFGVPILPKNGYSPEAGLFKKQYSPGTYKSTPPYKAVFEALSEEKGNQDADLVLDESDYDKNKISFHDKRNIKDFINLNNDDKLMDQSFANVKRSVYGHIGTSTCANTDYLDQWEKDPNTGKAKSISAIELLKLGTKVSRYTKVFLTKGPAPSTTRARGQLPLERTEGYKRYKHFYENQNVRYNTAGDTFNWYIISMAWYSTMPVSSAYDSPYGGWSNCGNSQNGISCGSVTSNCGSGTSTFGGGSSSCGGGFSSCGGGGGFSSCGGGGGGC